MKNTNQIDQLEASDRMAKQFQEIGNDIYRLSAQKNFAGVLQLFVNMLISLLEKGQIRKVNQRIRFIGKLYRIGNEYIRFMIENLFVGSLRGLRRRCDSVQWNEIYLRMPITLRNLYSQQNQKLNSQFL